MPDCFCKRDGLAISNMTRSLLDAAIGTRRSDGHDSTRASVDFHRA